MSQTFFHNVFIIFFALFAVIRVYFQWRARLVQGQVEYKESKLNIALRALIGAIFFLGVCSTSSARRSWCGRNCRCRNGYSGLALCWVESVFHSSRGHNLPSGVIFPQRSMFVRSIRW